MNKNLERDLDIVAKEIRHSLRNIKGFMEKCDESFITPHGEHIDFIPNDEITTKLYEVLSVLKTLEYRLLFSANMQASNNKHASDHLPQYMPNSSLYG